ERSGGGNERWVWRKFCEWLHEKKLVGSYHGCVAFPVHDPAGNVVAAHYRHKDGSWRYFPQGQKCVRLSLAATMTIAPMVAVAVRSFLNLKSFAVGLDVVTVTWLFVATVVNFQPPRENSQSTRPQILR